jgi:phage terminase large subunit
MSAPIIPDLAVRPPDLRALADELHIPLAELEAAAADGVLADAPAQAVEALARWLDDPVAFVREVFGAEPDAWQIDALLAMCREPRTALKACKGPGKSTVFAWYGWWALGLHAHANGIALSITLDNLRDNLWKEMALWYARPRAAWLRAEFTINSERIAHRRHPKTWWLSARSFPQDARPDQQANTLAGLHAAFVFILADESSDYPQGVMDAAEGIFSVQGCEAHLAQAGNPTRCEGPLYVACTRDRALWTVIEITGDPDDPKRSPRISLEYARQMIDAWGRDNPVVMVNLLGQFPPTQSDKLLGPNDITAAEARDCARRDYDGEAIVYGLDVARFGDDKCHLRKRQGVVAFRGQDFRNLDGPELANRVSMIVLREQKESGRRPDAIYVDVAGVGASAYDHLKLLGWGDILVPVDFGGGADEPERFANKRAEMWWRMSEWTRKRGCLPTGSNQLGRDLTAPSFRFKLVGKRTVMLLESKDDLRKRGVPSPDEGDALALTFYAAVQVRRDYQPDARAQTGGRVATEYNPFASAGRVATDYSPFGGA